MPCSPARQDGEARKGASAGRFWFWRGLRPLAFMSPAAWSSSLRGSASTRFSCNASDTRRRCSTRREQPLLRGDALPNRTDASSVSDATVPLRPPSASAPPPPPPSAQTERQSDRIGDFLRNESQGRDPRLILAAQQALMKLGYELKADGNDGSITRQALLDFERSHNLPRTTEVTADLVKILDSAVRSASRGAHAPPL